MELGRSSYAPHAALLFVYTVLWMVIVFLLRQIFVRSCYETKTLASERPETCTGTSLGRQKNSSVRYNTQIMDEIETEVGGLITI